MTVSSRFRLAAAIAAVSSLPLGVATAQTAQASSAVNLEGMWVGEFTGATSARFFRLMMRPDAGRLIGQLDIPLIGQRELRLQSLVIGADSMSFAITRRDGAQQFSGRRTDAGTVRGQSRGPDGTGTFTMVRLGQLDTARFHELTGNYALQSGDTISIGQIYDVEDLPAFFNHRTRRMGVLFPAADSEYVVGKSLGVMYPFESRVTVRRRNGGITGLRWADAKGQTQSAARLNDYREVIVSFGHDSIRLGGTLFLPTSPGPHPAIINVMGPGAGAGSRNIGETAPFFASQGVAVLVYDKRGFGASVGGNWREATVPQLADDAIAAVSYLKQRSDIDASRIGLWATSNGAWVAPEAASRSKDVSFIIMRSPPLLPAAENVLHELASDLRAERFAEADVQRAVALRKLFTDAVLTNSGWDKVAREIGASREASWFRLARVPANMATPPTVQDTQWLRRYREVLAFDPRVAWSKTTIPVLAFFGGMDKSIPPELSRSLLEEALRSAGNTRSSIVFLPQANHIMFETSPDDPYVGARQDTSPLNSHSALGYHDGIARWLRKMRIVR